MSGVKKNNSTNADVGINQSINDLWIPITWRNTGSENHRSDGRKSVNTFVLASSGCNWESFQRNLFQLGENLSNARIIYIDSDDDEIPIESQCEFDEALRRAKNLVGKNLPSLQLIVDQGFHPSDKNKKTGASSRVPIPLAMPPANVNAECHDSKEIKATQKDERKIDEAKSLDDVPPKWFTTYMQKMKQDIVAEVSQKVKKTVTGALRKNCVRQNHSTHLQRPGFDIGYRPPSHQQGKFSQACNNSANSSQNYQNSLPSSRWVERKSPNFEDSDSDHPEFTTNATHLPTRNAKSSSSLLRSYEFRETIKSRRQSRNGNSKPESSNLPANFDEELDTPYRRMIASGIRQVSLTPVDASDILETPTLKLRLADSCDSGNFRVETKLTEEKLRMGCSITGNDMLENKNDRVPDYSVLSSSDNISIISDVSDNSETEKMSNSFELINERANNREESNDSRNILIPSEYEDKNNRERTIAETEATCDSSSFEILPDTLSPALSIHMDEDHFSPITNITKSYNFNDETTMDKRGNKNRIESSLLAVDTQGKIYRRNIIETEQREIESPEIILEKRTDGTYSYVADTLPGSFKESTIQRDRSDSSNGETVTATDNSAGDHEPDTTKKCPDEGTNEKDRSNGGNSSRFIYTSTDNYDTCFDPVMGQSHQEFTSHATFGRHDRPFSTMNSYSSMSSNSSHRVGNARQWSSTKLESDDKYQEGFDSVRPKVSRNSATNWNYKFSSTANGDSRNFDEMRKAPNLSTARNTIIINDSSSEILLPMPTPQEPLVHGGIDSAIGAWRTACRMENETWPPQTNDAADEPKSGQR